MGNGENKQAKSCVKKVAGMIGRKPGLFLATTLFPCIIFTILAVTLGNLNITVDNKGWKSRGTLAANREMQNDLLFKYQEDLYYDSFIDLPGEGAGSNDSPWDYIQENVASGFVNIGTYGRKIMEVESDQSCNSEWYSLRGQSNQNSLLAVWKANSELSILDTNVLIDICKAERRTVESLEEHDFCRLCESSCLAPFSLVTAISIHLALDDGATCEDFIAAYSPKQSEITQSLVTCANARRTSGSCNFSLFGTHLVDADFGVQGNTVLKFSSSYLYTSSNIDIAEAENLLNIYDTFGTSDSNLFQGVYDTDYNNFNDLAQNIIMVKDAALAFVSVLVTAIAILWHTKSPFLTIMGILQILFSAPLSYCVYYFIAGVKFFPIINLIGLFVSSALGADDLFVTVDKWKNARIAYPSKTTEEIAEVAFPDAAVAMFLTTSTTGVAFFATCLSPVPPIFTFALFCGLLVVFNYVLTCALIFPSLCLYDKWLLNGEMGFFVATCRKGVSKRMEDENALGDCPVDDSKESPDSVTLIHGIMSFYYRMLHRFRIGVIVIMVCAVALSTYFALGMKLPENSKVRMLPTHISFEQHYNWSQKLLAFELFTARGASVRFLFGVKAADTGNYRDPDTMSQLVLDDSFDPSSTDAQEYLKGFCDRMADTDYIGTEENYVCPINAFEIWLAEQAAKDLSSQMSGYVEACKNGTGSLPMDEAYFHSCFTFWNRNIGEDLYNNFHVFDRDGVVKVMGIETRTSVSFDSPYPELQRAWQNYEDWIISDSATAPVGVNSCFHTGSIWLWKDTNGQMIQTAFSAAVIAIVFSASIVLISSRSLRLTLISGCCILYVLAAATSCLVSIGWELGFLESVCFAILIGISCDFVIHFGHAYIAFDGYRQREERTEYAAIHMGPSILASAMTTFSAALVMLFCTLTFFTKFAEMLLLTMTHAIIGSFVLYLVLTDTFGPAEPTKLYDKVTARLCMKKTEDDVDDLDKSVHHTSYGVSRTQGSDVKITSHRVAHDSQKRFGLKDNVNEDIFENNL